MRQTIHGIRRTLSKNCILANFRENGVVVFDNHTLYVWYGFSRVDDDVEIKHVLKINLSPEIPRTSVVERIHVHEDGSRIVIITSKTAYLVLVSPEVAMMRCVKADYFCECINLYSTHSEAYPVCERFVPGPSNSPSRQMAVLFSDSTIRIFYLDDNNEPPVIIDFTPFLSTNDLNASNRIGLLKSISSFDFIYSPLHPKLVAIDVEGDSYFVLFSDSFRHTIKPLISPPQLSFDPSHITTIHHPYEEVFSMFSIFTPAQGGIVSHVIAVENGSSLVLSMAEQIVLPSPSKSVRISSSLRLCSYLLATNDRVFYVDVRPWIVHTTNRLQGISSPSLQDSRFQELSIAYGPADEKNFAHNAAVHCSGDKENTTLFLSTVASTCLSAAFLRVDTTLIAPSTSTTSLNDTIGPSFMEKDVDGILSTKNILPKIVGHTPLDNVEVVKDTEKWIQNFTNNVKIDRKAASVTLDRLSEIGQLVKNAEEEKQNLNRRLLHLFDSMADVKFKIEQKKTSIDSLNNRLNNLTRRVTGNQPLTGQEEKMLTTLSNYRNQAVDYLLKAPKLSLQIAAEKQKAFGTAVPFQPSVNSRLSSVDKMVNEITVLTERVTTIDKNVREMEVASS